MVAPEDELYFGGIGGTHSKLFLIDYEPEKPSVAYVGSANATQRSHLSDNEIGILSTSSEFAAQVCEKVFRWDTAKDSHRESVENFHVVLGSNPLVRSAQFLRSFWVSLFLAY